MWREHNSIYANPIKYIATYVTRQGQLFYDDDVDELRLIRSLGMLNVHKHNNYARIKIKCNKLHGNTMYRGTWSCNNRRLNLEVVADALCPKFRDNI